MEAVQGQVLWASDKQKFPNFLALPYGPSKSPQSHSNRGGQRTTSETVTPLNPVPGVFFSIRQLGPRGAAVPVHQPEDLSQTLRRGDCSGPAEVTAHNGRIVCTEPHPITPSNWPTFSFA